MYKCRLSQRRFFRGGLVLGVCGLHRICIGLKLKPREGLKKSEKPIEKMEKKI